MSGLGKVILVQRDRRAMEAMRLGFEREGVAVVAATSVDEAKPAISGEVGLIVAGADSAGDAATVLGAIANAVEGAGVDPPVLYVGNGASRAEAWELGAHEVLDPPTYLRDVVTIGKLLAGTKPGHRALVHGDLGDTFGVFYLIRALAATGRSGVLFLARGLRRGEVRFFAEDGGTGEVTSAQVGALHGQAALHQLLLWTEARFEFRHEPVVRRRQIPMETSAVLADAERFLLDIREMAAGMSPSSVFEQDTTRMSAMGKKIPTEVHGVLRLFDGNRTVADVLEDGPYRVFETLRVAARAVEAGLLKRVETAKPKAAMRAVLAVEEWLVGTESKEAVLDRLKPSGDTGPVEIEEEEEPREKSGTHSTRRRRKKRRASAERPAVKPPAAAKPAAPAVVDIDWGALVPRASGPDLGALSTVVPSTAASGEIASRRSGREGLESLTDSELRDRLFPAEKIEVDASIAKQQEEELAKALREAHEAELRAAKEERERREREEAKAKAKAEKEAAEKAVREAAEAKALADAKAADEKAAREAAEAKAAADKAATDKAAADKAAAAKAAADKAAADKAAAEKEAADWDAMKKAAEAKVAAEMAALAVKAGVAEKPVEKPAEKPELADKTEPTPRIDDASPTELSRSGWTEKSGEIRIAAAPAAERPVESGPSILIEDLAAAHQAATAAVAAHPPSAHPPAATPAPASKPVAATPTATPAPAPAAAGKPAQRKRPTTPPSHLGDVARVRADAHNVAAHATHFTDDEEAFFQEGAHPEFGKTKEPSESFDDLDAGYQPQTFWERLMGKKPTKKPPQRGGGGPTRKR
jgi:hypothetical protein